MNNKILLSIPFLMLLNGCSVTQDISDNLKARSIFNDDFEYTVKNLNTLEDNKVLLENIENDSEIMSILNRNVKIDDMNSKFYVDYLMLKSVIRQEEILLNDNKLTEIKKKEKEQSNFLMDLKVSLINCTQENYPIGQKSFDEKYQKLKIKYPDQFTSFSHSFENDIKKCLSLKEPQATEHKSEINVVDKKNEDKKKETIKKDIVIVPVVDSKPKTQNDTSNAIVKKTDSLEDKYNNLESKIYQLFIPIKVHCNEEDAHLLKNDIVEFQKELKSLTKDKKLYDYAYKKYQKEIENCYLLYNQLDEPIKAKKIEIKKDTTFKGYKQSALGADVYSVSDYLFNLKDDQINSTLKEYSATVFKIDTSDGLIFYDNIDYHGKKYSIFSNENSHFQVYYPYDQNFKFDKTVPISDLYYSVFDYGYLDGYKTIILNKIIK